MSGEESWLRAFPSAPPGQHFPETSWPRVWDAVRKSDGERKAAIAELFRTYYKPVYRFFERALSVPASDVADLTQAFFEAFLEKDHWQHIERETSFRGYLRTLCRWHFGEWCARRGIARKRLTARLGAGDADAPDPRPDDLERAIDEEFRRSYIADALEATRAALARKGKEAHYRVLLAKVAYEGDREPTNTEIAAAQGLPLDDVRNRLYAARRILRRELHRLAALRSNDPDGELRALGVDLSS